MSPRFDGDAHGPLGGEAPLECLWGGAQPAFLHDLAAVLVDEAKVGVFVAEVQSGCHLWMLFATIHGGPILLSGPVEPVNHCRPFRVLRRGSAFSSHLRRISLLSTWVNGASCGWPGLRGWNHRVRLESEPEVADARGSEDGGTRSCAPGPHEGPRRLQAPVRESSYQGKARLRRRAPCAHSRRF